MGLIPMGSDSRKWRPATGPSYWKEAHCACAYSTSRFKPNQLERRNRSGCAFHVYATAVFICVTSCICLWIRNMCSDSLLAEPGDMKPKQPAIHLAVKRGHLKVKEVMLYVPGSSRSELLHKAMLVGSWGWQQNRQNTDKISNWVIRAGLVLEARFSQQSDGNHTRLYMAAHGLGRCALCQVTNCLDGWAHSLGWWKGLHPDGGQSLLGFPWTKCWGQFSSISLSMVWIRGWSTPSVSSRQVAWGCWSAGG